MNGVPMERQSWTISATLAPPVRGLPAVPPIFDEIRNWMIPVARKHALAVERRLLAEIRDFQSRVDVSRGSAYDGGMTMTQAETHRALIADCTCRSCGEEFVTPAERIGHECPVSAIVRLNAYLDSLADGWEVRCVHNLHRDRVATLSETDAATMLHSLATGISSPVATVGRTARLDAAVRNVPTGSAAVAGRPNRYEATCAVCRQTVAVGEGTISRNASVDHTERGAWRTVHVTCPAVSATSAPAPTERRADGEVHRVGETIYRVRTSRSRGTRYAQRASVFHGHVSWTFERGAMRLLSDATLLTWEQARDFGLLHGTCVRCSRALTDNRSVAAGYGATCAGIMGWPYPSAAEADALIANRTAR